MSQDPSCPNCQSEYAYPTGLLMVCPDCNHEWNPNEVASNTEGPVAGGQVIDANGNVLQSGDTVMITKDLPVKGFAKSIKAGTKVKNIRLTTDGDHNIDCKIDSFGAIALKSEFVKKV